MAGDGNETFTKHKDRNYEDGGLGETGGYTAEGTNEGLKGEGNISNPQALTEGDAVTKPGETETGLSFKDLSGGDDGGGVKESLQGLAGSGGSKGVVDSVKDLAGGSSGEGQSIKDLTDGSGGNSMVDSIKQLAGGGDEGQSVKELSGKKWGAE